MQAKNANLENCQFVNRDIWVLSKIFSKSYCIGFLKKRLSCTSVG